MTADFAILLIFAGIIVYPLILGPLVPRLAVFVRADSRTCTETWLLCVITLVMTAMLLHWIPRMGELWENCGKNVLDITT